jgi:hypothetical protein
VRKPLEKLLVHEWIDSAGVIAAILISTFSAYSSWKSLQMKGETIAISAGESDTTDQCRPDVVM